MKKAWLRFEEEESIHHLFLTFDASFEGVMQQFGKIPQTYLIFHQKTAIWAVRWRDVYQIGEALLLLYKNKNVRKRFWQEFQSVTAQLTRFMRKLNKKYLRTLSNGTLLEVYKKFTRLYKDFWRVSWIFEALTLSLEKKRERQKMLNQLLETVAFWQGYRKKHAMLALHHLELMLAEIGKRFALSCAAMMYTLPFEIEGISEKTVEQLRENITMRRKSCVLYWKGENVVSILKKQDARMLKKKLYGSVASVRVERKKVKGLGVFSGDVNGKVAIVRTQKDMARVGANSVAIVPHVTPKHFLLFQKAKAIVTDWGGVTSHAAIMAREEGIPCIVGTKVATLFFKNGDLVELNAGEGFVRKVQLAGYRD